jgi:hypothetical protein
MGKSDSLRTGVAYSRCAAWRCCTEGQLARRDCASSTHRIAPKRRFYFRQGDTSWLHYDIRNSRIRLKSLTMLC